MNSKPMLQWATSVFSQAFANKTETLVAVQTNLAELIKS
jgi:hypothetical protein